ncbi:hypothetical protein AAG906_016943 [Vitis piasezkii]
MPRSMGHHPIFASNRYTHHTAYKLRVCPDNLSDIFCKEEGRSTAPSWLSFNIDVVFGHQSWVMKVTSTGAKAWKDASEKASDRCRPCSKKQGGSGRRTRCCEFKHLHQALLTADSLGVNERTPTRTRRQHTLETQSPPLTCPMYGLMKDPYHSITRHGTKTRTPLLSDAMCTKLGPQTRGMEKPRVAKAQEAYSGPSYAPIIPDRPPHPPLQQVGGDMVSRGPPSSISRRLDDMLSVFQFSHYQLRAPKRVHRAKVLRIRRV